MGGYSSTDPCKGTRLATTSLVTCKAGVVGGGAGSICDTLLYGVYIPANGTAGNLLIGGMYDTAGVAQNLQITGLTTQDYFWMPPAPILNSLAAFTFTASIANLIWVFTRAYIGPEAP